MKLFAQLTKVDEAKRLVYGQLTSETVDKADEVMDYASSKPHFQKWSADVHADTAGKSLGNLRAMHGKVSAGVLKGIDFDDAAKTINICAKVVDDNEWNKVLEGCYTGFSVGGGYGNRAVEKMDGKDVSRYTAIPNEASLVDRPCVPTAKFFEVQKADGALAKVDFVKPEGGALAKYEAEDVTIQGTPEQVDELCRLMKAKGLDMTAVLAKLQDEVGAAGTGGEPTIKAATEEPLTDQEPGVAVDPDATVPVIAKAASMKAAADCGPGDMLPHGTDGTADDDEWENAMDADGKTPMRKKKAAKADSKADLAKLELAKADLAKMVSDAVTAATAPLSKALGEATEKIAKLEAMPAPTTVRLRAVSKAEDTISDEQKALAKAAADAAPITDTAGEKHEVAGLIKMAHKHAGKPMTLPDHLRK